MAHAALLRVERTCFIVQLAVPPVRCTVTPLVSRLPTSGGGMAQLLTRRWVDGFVQAAYLSLYRLFDLVVSNACVLFG